MTQNISDAQHLELERNLNAAIHELVFAMHHSENDELEEARECLLQVELNVSHVKELLLNLP